MNMIEFIKHIFNIVDYNKKNNSKLLLSSEPGQIIECEFCESYKDPSLENPICNNCVKNRYPRFKLFVLNSNCYPNWIEDGIEI